MVSIVSDLIFHLQSLTSFKLLSLFFNLDFEIVNVARVKRERERAEMKL